MSETDENLRRVKKAILAGRTFDAIKAHREASGGSIMDAKLFIDKLEAQLRAEEPEKFVEDPSSAGCSIAFLWVWMVFFGLAFFLPGAWAIVSNLLFANGAVTEEGVVVKHLGTTYYPWPTKVVLRPVLRPGRFEIEVTPSLGKFGHRKPGLGARLPILVRKDRPGEARVAGGGLYLPAGMCCIIGGGNMGLAMLGLWSWRRALKSRERKQDTTL
jgi:hypothetical protein